MIKKFKTFESSKLTDTINEIEDIFKNLDLDYDLEVMVSEANVSQHHLHSEVSLKDGDLIRTKIKVIIVTIKFLRIQVQILEKTSPNWLKGLFLLD